MVSCSSGKKLLCWVPWFFSAFVSDLEKGLSNEMTGLAEVIGLLRFRRTSAS